MNNHSCLLHELDSWLDTYLDLASFSAMDYCINGLQVGDLDHKIHKIAVATDACDAVFERAVLHDADMLIVHHGIFWGSKPEAIIGKLYKRIKILIDNNVALYAAHLPLDAHKECGNNRALAQGLRLQQLEDFAYINNKPIGLAGYLEKADKFTNVVNSFWSSNQDESIKMYRFGREIIHKIALCSGGGASFIDEAIAQKVDLFITGEFSHSYYHKAREAGLNVLAAGHYKTETKGVQLLAQKLEEKFSLPTEFIDFPTGL